MSSPPDLFDLENLALSDARATLDDPRAEAGQLRDSLAMLSTAYERLLRETRRLIRRSDREELEMNQLNQRLHDLAAELEYRATHDSLTGVLNRAAVIERAQRLLSSGGLALIVLDIDHFKQVNDCFGHPIGDSVICGVVDCLKRIVPKAAQVGRVGGEEFTVLLPDMGLDEALTVAERLRAALPLQAFDLPDSRTVTASFGVSCLPKDASFETAYRQADDALYVAKRQGRNRVEAASLEPH